MAPNLPPPILPNPQSRGPAWLGKRHADRPSAIELPAGLVGLRQFFDAARAQFDEDELNIAEWRQAREAFERAYDAFATQAAESTITSLCLWARRTIDMAVEISTARGYYDGRL